jgi:hypothetical protein
MTRGGVVIEDVDPRTEAPPFGGATTPHTIDLYEPSPMVGGGLSMFATPSYGSGLIATNWSPLSHHGLVAVLSDVLGKVLDGAPVNVDQFVGRWVAIEERQLLRLGVANTTLGEDATVGRKVFDRGGKFRVILGPLRRKAFEELQPGKAGLELLREVKAQGC